MFNLTAVPVPDLTGKTILVTGAGKGIGAELVRILHARGASVYAGMHAADAVEAPPEGVVPLALDVTRQDEVDSAAARISDEVGRLDVLVNNAGTISTIGPYGSLDPEALMQALEVNVMGVHRMTIAALPLLCKASGRIINAGTGAATTPMEGWTAYCTSKAGTQMLTRMMALELAPEGIQAFFLGIPPTDTAMQDKIRSSGINPISRIPKDKLLPADVAASCMAWLCGDGAKELTETLLDVRQEPFTSRMNAGQ